MFDGLDLTIPRGRITGLLGPSSCGKTTLMRSIVGVQRIHGGRVTVLGAAAGSAGLRRRVAYGTQGAAVYGDLTVRQNMRYLAAVLGVDRREADRVISEAGLSSHAAAGGLPQRRAGEPGLAGHGPARRAGGDRARRADRRPRPGAAGRPVDAVRRIADAGTTLLASSHVMDEAARCDRLVLMRAGRVIAQTTPEALSAETGERDPEAAFLALIARDEAAHAPSRRGRRGEQGEEGRR